MKTIIILFTSLITFIATSFFVSKPDSPAPENGTPSDWKVLFDGSGVDSWRVYNGDHFPSDVWKIEDDALVMRKDETHTGSFDLITKEKYSNFEFELEWIISESGNSGIFHHAVEQPGMAIYWSGIEMQIIDSEGYGRDNLTDLQHSGALYDMRAAAPQNENPQGEWNHTRIISSGPKIEYWQNGEKVVEFKRWDAEWYDLVRNSKFECHPSFGHAPEGHIGLQDHGDVVKFRNIEILNEIGSICIIVLHSNTEL